MLQPDHSSTPQESRQPPPSAPLRVMPPPPKPVAPPPRTRTRRQKDQNTPDTMFPTQDTDTSADTAPSQGEHRGPYPTMVQRVAGLLRRPQQLMKRQREESHLLGKIQYLNNRETGGGCVIDDNGLLWYAPLGCTLRLAIPRSLAPGILELVHTTCGHPRVKKRRPKLRAFLRVPKAQEFHQSAYYHSTISLPQALGSP